MQPAGTLQQYGLTFSPKPKFIHQWFNIPKLRNKNSVYVHDDRMVSFSVQNHSQVSPTYSEGNPSTNVWTPHFIFGFY